MTNEIREIKREVVNTVIQYECPECKILRSSKDSAEYCLATHERNRKQASCIHEWGYSIISDWNEGSDAIQRYCTKCQYENGVKEISHVPYDNQKLLHDLYNILD